MFFFALLFDPRDHLGSGEEHVVFISRFYLGRWMRCRAASVLCLDRPVSRSAVPPRSTRSWALQAAEERNLQ